MLAKQLGTSTGGEIPISRQCCIHCSMFDSQAQVYTLSYKASSNILYSSLFDSQASVHWRTQGGPWAPARAPLGSTLLDLINVSFSKEKI